MYSWYSSINEFLSLYISYKTTIHGGKFVDITSKNLYLNGSGVTPSLPYVGLQLPIHLWIKSKDCHVEQPHHLPKFATCLYYGTALDVLNRSFERIRVCLINHWHNWSYPNIRYKLVIAHRLHIPSTSVHCHNE